MTKLHDYIQTCQCLSLLESEYKLNYLSYGPSLTYRHHHKNDQKYSSNIFEFPLNMDIQKSRIPHQNNVEVDGKIISLSSTIFQYNDKLEYFPAVNNLGFLSMLPITKESTENYWKRST